jgi:hypothetical protein
MVTLPIRLEKWVNQSIILEIHVNKTRKEHAWVDWFSYTFKSNIRRLYLLKKLHFPPLRLCDILINFDSFTTYID